MRVSGMNPQHGVKPVDVSFKLGPRINASGRLADASLAVELLLSDDSAFCMETSLKLDSFNRERQEIERSIVEQAKQQVEETQSESSGLVVFGEDILKRRPLERHGGHLFGQRLEELGQLGGALKPLFGPGHVALLLGGGLHAL